MCTQATFPFVSTTEGNSNPLQYSCLENPMDGGASWATVHRVTKSWTWLSDFTFPAIWAFLPVGSDVCHVENCLAHEVLFGLFPNWFWHEWCWGSFMSTDCYLGIFANWFWCQSAVEDHLWTWSAFGHSCQLMLTSDRCWGPFVSTSAIWVFCQLVLTFDYHCGPFVLGFWHLTTTMDHLYALQCSCLENPRDGEPGGLLSTGSHRVGHNWSDLAAAADHLCWGSVCLGLCTGHPWRGFMIDLSCGMWPYIPFV